MNKNSLKYFIVFLFAFFFLLYYFTSLGLVEMDKVFLTISTFLFSIFAGFFVSRQGARYSVLREKIANFDGGMSSIYRSSGHLGLSFQKKIGKILENHYKVISDNKAWDYHFTHKSSTLTSIHKLIEEAIKDKTVPSLKSAVLIQIMAALREAQLLRKNMVALYQERIPQFQWILLYSLSLVLLITLSTIFSQYLWLSSALKAAFGFSVVAIIVLLRQLDSLKFFEGTIGENSAKDVVEIIKGKK